MDANPPPAPPAAPTATPAAPPQPRATAPGRSAEDRVWIVAVVVAAVPLLLLFFLAMAAPAFLSPLTDGRVTVAGLAPAVPFVVVLVGMVFVAGLLSRYAHPLLGVVVGAVWLAVGLFAVILGPAIVLIIDGLTGT